MREAEGWDAAPLVGPSTLLAEPGKSGVSEAVRELAGVATSEAAEGARTDWSTLLEAELEKARQIQDELPALRRGREAEQAVVTVFLHSQPIGKKAYTPELLRMAGTTAPDGIELEKGLRRWREVSWFLDDEDADLATPEAAPALPKSWRLGNRPNLRQMHDEACQQRVSQAQVDERLREETRTARALTEGAKAAGATVHLLPASPRDVGDDGSFRYVIPDLAELLPKLLEASAGNDLPPLPGRRGDQRGRGWEGPGRCPGRDRRAPGDGVRGAEGRIGVCAVEGFFVPIESGNTDTL